MFYLDNNTVTTDKYDMAKFMDFDEYGVFDSLNSYMLYQIPLLQTIGYYTLRTEMNRPDMLAYNIYGDTQYWWVLMWYNNLLKPQDLKAGMKIKYPSLSAIEQLYMTASLNEKVKNK